MNDHAVEGCVVGNTITTVLTPPRFEMRVVLEYGAKMPEKARPTDLGYDLFAIEDVVLYPGVVTKVRTGVKIGFPPYMGGLLRDRSSMATKAEVFVVAGVIDPEYTGEIIVAFFNPGEVTTCQKHEIGSGDLTSVTTTYEGHYKINAGDKIAQLILIPSVTAPVVEVKSLDETSRGENGFGSTGK